MVPARFFVRAVLVTALCYDVGVVKGGDADLDAVKTLFGAVYVLNPVDEGPRIEHVIGNKDNVFAERRAAMAEMLSFLPPDLPVHVMGV